jgi:hypothetical protein
MAQIRIVPTALILAEELFRHPTTAAVNGTFSEYAAT